MYRFCTPNEFFSQTTVTFLQIEFFLKCVFLSYCNKNKTRRKVIIPKHVMEYIHLMMFKRKIK